MEGIIGTKGDRLMWSDILEDVNPCRNIIDELDREEVENSADSKNK